MKIGFTFKDIKVMDKANIGEINIQVQYAPGELVGEYELFRRAIKELPQIAGDLGSAFLAVNEMDKAFDGLADANHAEENVEEAKQSAVNKIMTVVNGLKNANKEQRPADENQAV